MQFTKTKNVFDKFRVDDFILERFGKADECEIEREKRMKKKIGAMLCATFKRAHKQTTTTDSQ